MIDRLYPGGTETQLVALIRNFDPGRVKAYLCLLDGEDDLSRSLEPPHCPVLRLGVRSLRRWHAVAKAWEFVRYLQRERIDVLQVYFPDSTYFGVPMGRFAGVPNIVRTRNNVNHWMTPTHRRLGRLLNRWITATVTNCEASRRAVIADEKPLPDTVIVLTNGVDLARFESIAPLGANHHPGGRRVGAVANLRPVKGLETLLEAAALLKPTYPDVTYEIAGEGDLRPTLQQRALALGLQEQWLLPGTIKDIPAFLGTLDVAVLCSHAEGMPNAILEYMAAGRPIVATAVGGTWQLIEDGVQGLLVRPGDAGALARALDRLLQDRTLASQLGAAARLRVEEKYSRGAMVRSFEEFYQRLMVEGHRLAN
jgi:glycosyltransferase involved in cell wall biosynthesis